MDNTIIYLVLIVVVFFAFRRISLWYWRVNEAIESLNISTRHLNDITNLLCGMALKQGVEKAFFPSQRNTNQEGFKDER